MSDTWTTAADLRGIVSALRAKISAEKAVDIEAYRLLHDENGDLRPAADSAIALWESGGGVWRDHHLAIAHHHRFYEHPPHAEASPRHSDHLKHWARVHGDDSFWARMRSHLSTVMGEPFPEDVLRSVRRRLPRDLFAPHLTLAEQALPTRPDLASFHLTEIQRSGFPASAIAEARKEFATETVTAALVAAREGRHDDALDALRPRLAADPDNPDLVRSLLFVCRKRMEALVIEEDWHHRSGPFLERVTDLLAPYRAALGTTEAPPPPIAAELARVEFFLGVNVLRTRLDIEKPPATLLEGAHAAVARLRQAFQLNPDLESVSGIYRGARGHLTTALLAVAYALQGLGQGDAVARRYLDEALEHRETVLTNPDSYQLALMVILGMAANTRAELDLGVAAVEKLQDNPATPPEIRRVALPRMRSELANRRMRVR
ncbi:MAG: hypothetical protein M0026_10415 [Nocardiopsaceae bacterium]|nr:hypothetical protein [Nocardiopsaceae bacterium]